MDPWILSGKDVLRISDDEKCLKKISVEVKNLSSEIAPTLCGIAGEIITADFENYLFILQLAEGYFISSK